MQQSRFLTVVIILIAIIAGLWMSYFIVDPKQTVAVKRIGQIVRVETEPGLYFKLPFIDQTIVIDGRLRRYDLPTQNIQVKGGAFYDVDAFYVYKITNAKLFLEKVRDGSTENLENINLQERFVFALRAVYGQRDFSAALSTERNAMMKDVLETLSQEAQTLGVTIVDVRIRKTDLTPAISKGTYERMSAERRATAAQTRSLGNAEKIRIIAEADRNYTETIAAAKRDGLIMRGEGEAEGLKIRNEAIKVDPEFYAFFSSMQAYQSMKNLPMVLSSDMDIFQYLRSPAKLADPMKIDRTPAN